MVAEMDAGFQKLAHGVGGHGHGKFVLFRLLRRGRGLPKQTPERAIDG
jgi:hypothetical protein